MTRENFQEAYQRALRYLSYRIRSSYEVCNKLEQKGFSDKVIQRVIDKLREYKILDDVAFAQRWIEDGLNIRGKGLFFLRRELQSKGISSKIIKAEFAKYASEDEYKIAFQVASHKKNKKNPEKMGFFLKSRGFSYEVIQKVVKNLYYKNQCY